MKTSCITEIRNICLKCHGTNASWVSVRHLLSTSQYSPVSCVTSWDSPLLVNPCLPQSLGSEFKHFVIKLLSQVVSHNVHHRTWSFHAHCTHLPYLIRHLNIALVELGHFMARNMDVWSCGVVHTSSSWLRVHLVHMVLVLTASVSHKVHPTEHWQVLSSLMWP